MLTSRRILVIIGGGIAAFKVLDLIRRLREHGARVTPVLTRGGAEFVTPLSVAALANARVFQDLFDLTDEAEMGHIELSRSADLIVVAPATADLLSKMAHGAADDLASTLLMATDTPVLAVPAMNVRMWLHPATQRNVATLRADGVGFIGPDQGDMACGEHGPGRMAEVAQIVAGVAAALAGGPLRGPLRGRRVLVTSGPTHEPIDPVRYIANRSSGRQGSAIAQALADLGAEVIFVTGPAVAPPPAGVAAVPVETAREMLAAVEAALPVDAAIFAAAVADWHVARPSDRKMKKTEAGVPVLELSENPDILARVSQRSSARPRLVVGFAAETHDVLDNATAKRARKGCDWMLANDVSDPSGIMGGTENAVTLITETGVETWARMSKTQVAQELARRVAQALA